MSYQKIVDYFEPKFLLGMTATPERTDDFDIFKMFDYNVAYEIRLQQALEENLLCPFHYFGIADISIDGNALDNNTDFKYLMDDERVNHIINKINDRGLRTLALTGENTQTEREDAIGRLEQDENPNCLDYIFTVDIFNEGVDIPSINQVVMLRATKSSIVFVQQLGRGLRTYNNKEYVIIIDFVGNYNNALC